MVNLDLDKVCSLAMPFCCGRHKLRERGGTIPWLNTVVAHNLNVMREARQPFRRLRIVNRISFSYLPSPDTMKQKERYRQYCW